MASNKKLSDGKEAIGVELDFFVAGVSGNASIYTAFSWRPERVGMFALRTPFQNSRIFDSPFGIVTPEARQRTREILRTQQVRLTKVQDIKQFKTFRKGA
jgi:hypothetical protein